MTDPLLEYAKMSKLVYDNIETSETVKKYRSGSDVAYVFNHYKGGVLIVCRGTDSVKDMFSNLNANYESSVVGKVHEGFNSGARGIYTQILNDIKPLKRERITLSGHSRGGSIALLLGMRLNIHGYNVSQVYTYNSPRCLTKTSIGQVLHHRFVMTGDKVHKLPRKYMGYKHDCKPIKGISPWFYKFMPFGLHEHFIDTCIEWLEGKS